MFKLIVIALVLVGLFTTSTAFSEVETYEDAIPVLKETGKKLYETASSTFEYVTGLFDLWDIDFNRNNSTEIEN